MTRLRGMAILKSTVHGSVAIDTAPVIVNEVTLVGSRCGRFEPALKLLRSEAMPLSRAPEAFARAATKGALKVLLKPPLRSAGAGLDIDRLLRARLGIGLILLQELRGITAVMYLRFC